MAIEQFGKSLLAEKRRRDKEFRKRDDRAALLGLAGTAAIGLYRQNLKERQQQFLNSQPVMDMKIKYNQAKRIADDTEAERQRIMNAGGNYEDYYFDKAFEDVKSAYLERYSDDSDRVAYINAGREDAGISAKARSIYKQQLEAQKAREEWADKFKAQGSFEDVFSMSNQRPTSVFEGVLNFLRGKSDNEISESTIKALRESSLGRIALPASPDQKSQAARLEEAYRRTNNLVEAQDVADLGKLKRDTKKEYSVLGGFNSNTGMYEYRKLVKEIDKVTNEQLGVNIVVEQSVNLNDSNAVNKAALRNLKTSFNPREEARKFLNGRGEKEFLRRIKNDPALTTMESYNNAVAAFVELVTDTDNEYVLNPQTDFTPIQEAALKSEFYSNKLAMISVDLNSEDPAVKAKGQKEFGVLMAEIAKLGEF